jgi:hypothetical protein
MMATGRGHLRTTTAARAGALAIAAAVLSLVLVSPALAQQQQPGVDLPVTAATDAAQPAVDAAAPAIDAAAAPPAVADPALPPAAGQAQDSAPPLRPQPAANPSQPEPRAQPMPAAATHEPEPVTRLAEPAVDAATPEVRAAERPTGGERPAPGTAETVNGPAASSVGTSQLLGETQSLLDPVADTAQSLLGPLGDATQPLLGSLGDALRVSPHEAVSHSRRDLPGTGGPEAGAPPHSPLSGSTFRDPWVSPLPAAVLGESAGSPPAGNRQSALLRPHSGDVTLSYGANFSQPTFAAPPGRGEGNAPGVGGSAPPSPAGATAGAGSSGSAPFAPIGLLLLLALAGPSLSRFLRTVPAFLRPTPFICALERPG